MLTKVNNINVLKVFFENPSGEFYLRQLAKLAGLSPSGTSKIIKKLEKTGFILTKREGKNLKIKVVRDEKFIQEKKGYNLLALRESGLVDYLRKIYEEPEAIVVFGSYSKGEDISNSDIDIAIITKKTEKIDFEKFEKYLKRKINIYEMDLKKSKKEFINTLVNGVILHGYLKVLR